MDKDYLWNVDFAEQLAKLSLEKEKQKIKPLYMSTVGYGNSYLKDRFKEYENEVKYRLPTGCLNFDGEYNNIWLTEKEINEVLNTKQRRDLPMNNFEGKFYVEKVGNGYVTTVEINDIYKEEVDECDPLVPLERLIEEILDEIEEEKKKQERLELLKKQVSELEE